VALLADELGSRPPRVARVTFVFLALLGALVVLALIVAMWLLVRRWL
jgi:F0F1-type ATP synthase membrane subunit c/vacuolar-type H+-ATPase subunit K